MPKQPNRTAFYFYMVEFRQNQLEKGITYANMTEVRIAADPGWRALSSEQKAKYKNMARDNKKQKVIVDEAKEQEMMDAAERQVIKKFIKERASNKVLIKEDFFIMDVNSYCYCNFQSRCLVGECTVLRFSVREGVKDYFHESINIGRIPIGYASDVKWSCKEYGLEEPAEDQPPTDLGALLQSLIKYMKGQIKQDTSLPPLYANSEKIPEVVDFVLEMCIAAGEDPSRFSVFKLESLFYYLNNEIRLLEYDKIAKIAVAKHMLVKDNFWYVYNGLSCEKHDSSIDDYRKPLQCTKSRVSRWAFRILERSCVVAGIDPVVGRHVPLKADKYDYVDVLLRKVKRKREEAWEARGSCVVRNKALDSWDTLKNTMDELCVQRSSYNKNVANDSDSLYGAVEGTRVNETKTCSEVPFNTVATQDITYKLDSMASNASFIPHRISMPDHQVIKPVVPAVTANVGPITQMGRGRVPDHQEIKPVVPAVTANVGPITQMGRGRVPDHQVIKPVVPAVTANVGPITQMGRGRVPDHQEIKPVVPAITTNVGPITQMGRGRVPDHQVIKPVHPAVTANVGPITQMGRGRGFTRTRGPSYDSDSWDV